MGIISAGESHIGRKRTSNQDSIFVSDELMLYIVADGMGGHNGGDIASQMTAKHLPDFVRTNPSLAPKELLKQATSFVNNAIYDHSKTSELLKGMGTTVATLFFRGPTLYVGNVGDSRTYLVQNQLLYQLSVDHSLVQEKLNLGLYTRDDAMKDKMKNVLVRAVGIDPELDADILSYKVVKNDLFLVCSDGLYSMVSEHDILLTLNECIPDLTAATAVHLRKATSALIDLANRNGGQDNISVVIALAH